MPILQAHDQGSGPDPRPSAGAPSDESAEARSATGPLADVPSIPHGPPFRLIDRVLHVEPARGHLIAVRRLTRADALWPGEADVTLDAASAPGFPRPLIIEALCQAAACLNALLGDPTPEGLTGRLHDRSTEHSRTHRGYLVAISGFRFPQHDPQDFPQIGDTLLLSVLRQESRGALVAFAARATLHRGACDTSALQSAASQPQAQSPATPDEEPGLVAAGRLLFAVTMA